jgi:type 1 fimbria pilin
MHKMIRLAAIPIIILLLMASVSFASPPADSGTTLRLYSDDVYVSGAGNAADTPKTIAAGTSSSITIVVYARNGNIPSGTYDSDNARFDLGSYTLSTPASPPNSSLSRTPHQYLYFAAQNFTANPTLDYITVPISVASNVPAGVYRFLPFIEHGSSISLESTRVTGGGQSNNIPFTTPYIYINVTNTSSPPSNPGPGPRGGNLAAPAIANRLLKQYNIKPKYVGGNYISKVTEQMGPGATFQGILKSNATLYEAAVRAYLISLGANIP